MGGVLMCVVSHSSHFPVVENVEEVLMLGVRGTFVRSDTLNLFSPLQAAHLHQLCTGNCLQGVVCFEPHHTSILAQSSNSLTEGVVA